MIRLQFGSAVGVGGSCSGPGLGWRGLLAEAVEDGSDQSLYLPVDVPVSVEVDETVEEQGSEPVHGRPDDEVRSGTRRRGQAARVDEPVELCDEHVMWVRTDCRSGFGAGCAEGEAGDRRVVDSPSDVAATEGNEALLPVAVCSADGPAQAFSQPSQHAV